ETLRTIMRDFLERQIAEGALEIDDVDHAAGQFLDLASGSFFRLRLFGSMEEPPPRDDIERVIRGAIRFFMAAYGTPLH
ncbi:TetR/AcrR family transcriptional regulator C-terminal domain-containing protein, partial [Rhizobium ruizarguesonis]